jgi:hypothetical protein
MPTERLQEGKLDIRLGATLHARLRQAAATEGIEPSKFVRKLITEHLAQAASAKLAAPSSRRKKETESQEQDRFLEAILLDFHTSKACRATGIDKAKVKAWLKDSAFVGEFCDAQEAYIEDIEATLVKLAKGEIKAGQGAFLAAQSFLNAHHPQHTGGRIKREMMTRQVGPMLERFYKVVSEVATDEIAARIIKRMKEIADKKLSEFSE